MKNFERIFFIAVVVILSMMLFKACNKKPVTGPTVTEYKDRLHRDTIIDQPYKEALLAEVSKWKDSAIRADKSRQQLQYLFDQQGEELYQVMNQVVPDTCKPYQLAMQAQATRLAKTIRDKELACDRAIQAQRNIAAGKDKLLVQCNKDKGRVLATVDTLARDLKKLQPKGYAFAGLTALSNYNNFDNAAVGVQLGYTGKNKTTYSAGVFNTKQVIFTVTKKIF